MNQTLPPTLYLTSLNHWIPVPLRGINTHRAQAKELRE